MRLFDNLASSVKRGARARLPFLSAFHQERPKFVATIDIDYVQRVSVGVEASTAEHAHQLVKRAFDGGTLFNDSATMPVLMHAFEPVRPDSPMQLLSLEEVDELPAADQSVHTLKCISAAYPLLTFARMIDALCDEELDPSDRPPAMVGIDIPMSELLQLRQLLRTLDAC
jgi:hypothetical protein